MTEAEIEQEIERLKGSPYVKLARYDAKRKLQQRLYSLRWLEKKGREIAAKNGEKADD